jgi:archaellum component FlaF (FlaF/FlaG flagellin family)
MKSYSIIWAVLAVVSILLSGCTSPSGQKNASEGLFNYTSASSQYKPIVIISSTIPASVGAVYIAYENPNYKIKMSYPSYLKKQEEISGEVIFFLSPQNSSTDAFPANLDIIVQNISSTPLSLEEFTNLSVAQMREMVPDNNITDSRKATLAKEDAYLLSYTGTQGLLKLKWMSVYTIKNDTLYLITYTAGADKFSNYLPTVSKMLDSFEIMD